jgi:hypothetical protein
MQTIMAGRMNGQYIIEGLSAGGFMVMFAVGVVLLDKGSAPGKGVSSQYRTFMMSLGLGLAAFGLIMTLTFVRIKMPSYMSVWSGE